MEAKPQRDTWSHKVDFLLACVGFSVGLGNVWRFPFLCYKNGGGAFLIPYFLCAIAGGIPLFFLEISVGQFMSLGGVNAWKICPILQGIGLTTVIIVFFLSCYYNIILTWAFYYVFQSFTSKLPWDSCNNYWNTDKCSMFNNGTSTDTMFTYNSSIYVGSSNESVMNMTQINVGSASHTRATDSVTEFWEHKVLAISSGIHDMGPIKWDLALTLLFAWTVVFLCIWKGIKASGKVMYFTATSPYIFMLILLIRMAFLPGAKDGILVYVLPDFEKLLHLEVWVDAGTQIFYTYSIANGTLTALGSYNKFHHNSYRDCIIFACINMGTSILAGFVIFEVLGFMAHEQNVPISQVAESGPGLAFIAYPKAVAQMPGAPFWSICFFLMIVLLGLDSQFVGMEGLITACVDTFPMLAITKRRKECFIAFLCVVEFLIGLSMVTSGGMYLLQLFDYYSQSRIVLFVSLFECIAIAWIYGINRFYDNLEMMFGFRINNYMKVMWAIVSPIYCLTIFILGSIDYTELTYTRPSGTYIYPNWAVAIGWCMALVSAVCIPITAVYQIIKVIIIQNKPFSALLQPQNLKMHQLRECDLKGVGNCPNGSSQHYNEHILI